MSKPSQTTTKVQSFQRNSIRNLKLNKINKHIEYLQLMNAHIPTLEEDDKENQMVNIDKAYLRQSFEKQGEQTDLTINCNEEGEEMSRRISILQKKVREKEEEIEKIKEERAQLEQIINYLKKQNNFLRQETQTLQYSQSRSRIQEEEITLRNSSEQSQEDFNKTEKFKDIYLTLLELHNQNSRLVTKIMELTYGRPTQEEIDIQTQRFFTQENEVQTESFFPEIKEFYSKYEFSVSYTSFLHNFTDNLQRLLSQLIQRHTQPLKCQIQLLQQLIKSSKKQQAQKISYMTRLLQSSQKTIKSLMQQMKQFQCESKHNYSLYLSVLKQQGRQP